jgi:hypothetical protein
VYPEFGGERPLDALLWFWADVQQRQTGRNSSGHDGIGRILGTSGIFG